MSSLDWNYTREELFEQQLQVSGEFAEHLEKCVACIQRQSCATADQYRWTLGRIAGDLQKTLSQDDRPRCPKPNCNEHAGHGGRCKPGVGF